MIELSAYTSTGRVFVHGIKYISRVDARTAVGGPIERGQSPIPPSDGSRDHCDSQYRKGGRREAVEYILRYRLHDARAWQACRHAEEIEGKPAWVFRLLRVRRWPWSRFDLTSIRNGSSSGSSLFASDGVIQRTRHGMSKLWESWIPHMVDGGREWG